MYTDSPFYRASSGVSGTSTPSRHGSGEIPAPRRRSSGPSGMASQLPDTDERSRAARDRFETMEERDQLRTQYNTRSYDARRSVEMMPIPPPRRPSQDHRSDQSTPSTESDKPGELRTRSRIELENFRRQAARQARPSSSRAVSAPGGMGFMEELPTMPEPRPHGINITVQVQRDSSQALSDAEAGQTRARSMPFTRALTTLGHALPDTQSRRFKYAVLCAQFTASIIVAGLTALATYLAAKANTHAGNNTDAIDQLRGVPPPPP